ncbi:MAG: 16S rRNA (adenine(1518)-N(6)/adenine(1519)-N(6))-dimethyltransferase RsmA [Candidatus Hydrothermarchaeales archaeon]
MTSKQSLLKHTQYLLRKHNVKLRHRLGQHFLVNEDILRRQVEYARLSSNDAVLEIGAGTGNLTEFLVKNAKRVFVIEKDTGMIRILKERFSDAEDLEIIEGDALKLDFPRFDKAVANIPYVISSPLTFKLLEHTFDRAVLTYQREFAERLIAKPGTKNYSRLSVATYYRARAEILEYIPRQAFYPVPKVASAIVELVPRRKILEVNEGVFSRVLKGLFSHRRKSVANAAFHSYQFIFGRDVSKEERRRRIRELFPDELLKKRVYQLLPEEFAELADIVWNATKR